MSKKPKDEEVKLNTHTYRCERCGAEFGVMYMGNGPLAVELQEQTVAAIGWHSVTTCGKCREARMGAPPED